MEEIKPKSKGGKRPGAGRPPSTLKGVLRKLPCQSAEIILHEINAHSKLVELAQHKDPYLRLHTIKFLWEQAFGKAKQPVENSGTITHEHVDLSRLSDIELDSVAKLVESATKGAGRQSE